MNVRISNRTLKKISLDMITNEVIPVSLHLIEIDGEERIPFLANEMMNGNQRLLM